MNRILLGFICALFITLMMTETISAAAGKVVTIKYYSTTQHDSCLMNVYLPAGYSDIADSSHHYPVFYLFHGGGENYNHWVNAGMADTTLNYYISTGKCVPMILVMPDCKNIAPETFANEMINDVIPYIESNYRVIADKDHRGVGGLSWGGMQAMELGIYHYEMFGYMAILSSGWFTSETSTYDRARNFLAAHSADMEKSIRYIYFAEGTSYDIAYNNGLATLKLFRDYDLTVHYWEFSGGHQWTTWKEDFKAFTPYLFRDSTTRYISLAFQGGYIKNSTVMTNLDSLAKAPVNPTRKGYSFTGWYNEPEYVNNFDFSTDTINSNITLYAKWNINSYKVAFNSKGGNYDPDTILAVYNTKIAEPVDPTKSGLYFSGWYTDTTYSQKWVFTSFPVTTDMTLYAKWSEVTSIEYNQNSEIALYPNPAKSYLQILNLQTKSSIDIYNLEGKLITHVDQLDATGTISIDMLPKGVYVLVINDTNKNYHLKFIKQ